MELREARTLARILMDKHGLKDWAFKFDRSVVRFGCCYGGRKTIQLSRELVKLNAKAQVRDTILHEIAHALVGCHNGHNRIWKAKARQLGISDNRCYSSKVVKTPKAKYTLECPVCKGQWGRNRMPKYAGSMSCGKCSDKFDPRFRLVLKVNK